MLAFSFIKELLSQIWYCIEDDDLFHVVLYTIQTFLVFIIFLCVLVIDVLLSPLEIIGTIIYFIIHKKLT